MVSHISKIAPNLKTLVLRSIYFNQNIPVQAFKNGSDNPISAIRALIKSGFVTETKERLTLTTTGEIELFRIYNGKPDLISFEEEFLADEVENDTGLVIAKRDVQAILHRLELERH